jgi:hypothetical protein
MSVLLGRPTLQEIYNPPSQMDVPMAVYTCYEPAALSLERPPCSGFVAAIKIGELALFLPRQFGER